MPTSPPFFRNGAGRPPAASRSCRTRAAKPGTGHDPTSRDPAPRPCFLEDNPLVAKTDGSGLGREAVRRSARAVGAAYIAVGHHACKGRARRFSVTEPNPEA
jgi:hypothetical protein